MKQLPLEFENRMKALLGDGFSDFCASLSEPPVKAFRVNKAKISIDDFEKIIESILDQFKKHAFTPIYYKTVEFNFQ